MAAKNRRMFELRLGKLGFILFVGGMSLLLFSMLFLGIFVGKNMEAYPEKFSPGVVELIRDRLFASAPQAGKETPSSETGKRDSPAGGEESFGLTFYETLGGKKTETAANPAGTVKKDETSEASVPVPVPAEKPVVPEMAAGSASGAGAVGNLSLPVMVGEGKKPILPPEKKPVADAGSGPGTANPAGVTADGMETQGKGRFEIQVAAYQDSRKAEKTMEKLKPLGFAPRVVMKEIPGKGKWFRVIIGGFDNREKAKTAADQIAGKVRGVKCVIRLTGKNGDH
jgi:cell division septation protein DedD